MVEQLPLFSNSDQDPVAPPPVPVSPAPTASKLSENSPLKAAIVAWCDYLAKEQASPHTVKAFGGDLRLFARFIGVGQNLGQITTRDLDNWLQWQRTNQQCSPKTYSRRVTSLKSFFRWLHQAHVLGSDPAAPVIQQTVISPLPEVLSEAEVQSALAGAQALRNGAVLTGPDDKAGDKQRESKPDMRPYVLFTLLLQTGIKKGECLALVPNHVDLSNPDEPVLWVRYPDPRQRYKERKLRLDPSWIPTYREYLAQFEPRDRLFPWSARRLEYLLEDISKAADLSKRISFDMCRWTCAVRDARAGMDKDKIRQKLGLSKIQWREIGMKLEKLVSPPL